MPRRTVDDPLTGTVGTVVETSCALTQARQRWGRVVDAADSAELEGEGAAAIYGLVETRLQLTLADRARAFNPDRIEGAAELGRRARTTTRTATRIACAPNTRKLIVRRTAAEQPNAQCDPTQDPLPHATTLTGSTHSLNAWPSAQEPPDSSSDPHAHRVVVPDQEPEQRSEPEPGLIQSTKPQR